MTKYRANIFGFAVMLVMSLMLNVCVLAEDIPLTLENVMATNIVYGQQLSASKLTGTAKVTADNTPVPGKFLWSVAGSTIPPVGTSSYTVTFTPDTPPAAGNTYSYPTTTVSVTVSAPTYTTASQISSAVSALSSSSTVSEIDTLADAMRALSTSEKRRLSRSTISKLGDLYRNAHSFTENVNVYSSGFSTSSRMPNSSDCYGAALAAGANVTIDLDQMEPTSSASLQFTASMNSSTRSIGAPVTLRVALPDNFSTSRDYYIRSDDGSLDCSLERVSGENQYYAVFTTLTMGTFRLIRESSSSQTNNNDYEISSFWEDVIDQIVDANPDDRIRVNVGSRTTMATDVLRELKGTEVTLVLRRSNGETISIYGKDIKSVSSSKDYYTMKTLADLYDADTHVSSSSSAPSKPEVIYVPTPAPAPAPVYTPVLTPAPPPPSLNTPAPSSSAPSSQAVSEPKDELPDIVIEAEEDNPPEESMSDLENESKPQESTGAQPINSVAFGLFIVAVIALAAAVSGGITFAAWRRRRKY
ncbi:hypothetical protein V6615_04095 [Oscillospiraceae bacterium PP1C4]